MAVRMFTVFLFWGLNTLCFGSEASEGGDQSHEFHSEDAFEMGGGLDGVCSTRSESEHDTRCHAAIRRFSVEKCLRDGYSGSIEEVSETYSFYYGSAGPCSTRPGNYVVVSCSAYFRCID